MAGRTKWHPVIRDHKNNLVSIHVSRHLVKRAWLIMNTVANALEKRGHRIDVVVVDLGDDKRYYKIVAYVKGEEIGFRIYEKDNRVKHKLTEKEQVAKRVYGRESSTKHDFVPSGKLVFNLLDCFATRKVWSDGVRKKLENKLDSIVLGFLNCARKKKQVARERRGWEKEWYEEKTREEEEQLQIDTFRKCYDSWMEKRQLRACLKAVEKAGLRRFGNIDKESDLGQFLQWGHRHVEEIDLLALIDEMKEDRELYQQKISIIARFRFAEK